MGFSPNARLRRISESPEQRCAKIKMMREKGRKKKGLMDGLSKGAIGKSQWAK